MNLKTLNTIFGEGLNFREGVGSYANVFTLTIIGTQSIYVCTVGDKIQVMCNFKHRFVATSTYYKTDNDAAKAIRSLFYSCVQNVFDLWGTPKDQVVTGGNDLQYMGRDSIAEMLERDGIEGIRESLIDERNVRNVSIKVELLYATGSDLSDQGRIVQSIAHFLLKEDKEQVSHSFLFPQPTGIKV